jgi:hypothetical protein
LFKIRKWKKFLKGKYYSVVKGIHRSEIYLREFPPKKNVKADLIRLVERGLNLLYIYSGGVQSYYNYRGQFEDMFNPIDIQDKLQVEYFKESDHTYTMLSDRHRLMLTISDWIQNHYKSVSLTIKEVKDFPSFLALEQEWNSLVEKSSTATVFFRHEWFKCWWKAYGEEKELFILLLYKENNHLIGISPLMISKKYFRGFPTRNIGFIENDETPCCDLILLQKEEERFKVIEKIVEYIIAKNRRWHIVLLQKVLKDSETYKNIMKVCCKKGLRVYERPSLNSPFLQISGDWDLFYKNTSQRFKKRLRYNNNMLKKLGTISIEGYTKPDEIKKVLPEIFDVGRKSWKEKIKRSISSTKQTRDFFSNLTAETTSNGWPLIWFLRINNEIVAFEFHLQYKGIIHALRSEFDEAYKNYSIGSVLDTHIVKSIFEKGFKEYDMGGNADTYKTHWTKSNRKHVDITILNKGIYPKFLAFLENQLISSIKKIRFIMAVRNIFKKKKRRQ